MYMDSNGNAAPLALRLSITPSSALHRVIVLLHVMSLAMPWFSALPAIYCFSIDLLILAHCWIYTHYDKSGIGRSDICELGTNAADEWWIRFENGDVKPARLANTQFVHPELVIMHLIIETRSRFLVFTSQSQSQETFRQLRIRLIHRLDKTL